MAFKVETLSNVTATGQGTPDYRPQIHAAIQRAGYQLDYNQTIVLFFLAALGVRLGASPYPWVTAPLAPGSLTHVIESSTGLATPYMVPAGYSFCMVEREWSGTEAIGLWMYMDGFAIANPGISTVGFMNSVVAYDSLWLDPTAAIAHTFDIVAENLDPMNALEGGITIATIMTEQGTPPLPTTKTVHCHHCGQDIPNIPRYQDDVVCPHCGGQIRLISFKPGGVRSR